MTFWLKLAARRAARRAELELRRAKRQCEKWGHWPLRGRCDWCGEPV